MAATHLALKARGDGGQSSIPPVFDLVLAFALTVMFGLVGDLYDFEQVSQGFDVRRNFFNIAVGVLMTASVGLRRTYPMVMLWIMVVAGVAQAFLFSGPSPSLVAVPIASYSIARWVPGGRSRIVLYVGFGASTLAAFSWTASAYDSSAAKIAFGLIALTCFAAVIVPYLAGRRILETTQAAIERAQATQARYEAELARREQEARITEARVRSEIARELHDIVAHSLSVIIVQADGGKALTAKKPEAAAQALETIAETGREALTEMRRIVGVLRNDPGQKADYVPNPGLIDIPSMVTKAGERVELIVTGTPPLVPATLGLTTYRVVQEGVTNFLKHAGPEAKARVTIAYSPTRIDLEIVDNGQGSSASDDGQGHGLRGMHERISSMGGQLVAGPGKGGGFLIRASLPVPTPGATTIV